MLNRQGRIFMACSMFMDTDWPGLLKLLVAHLVRRKMMFALVGLWSMVLISHSYLISNVSVGRILFKMHYIDCCVFTPEPTSIVCGQHLEGRGGGLVRQHQQIVKHI